MEQEGSLIPTATRRADSKHFHRKSSSLFKKTCLVLKFRLWNMYGHARTFTSAYEWFVAFIILLNIGILVADTFEIVSVNTGWFLSVLDCFFLGIYLMEFLMKFLVFGHLYFKAMRNDLDFLLLLISLVEMWVEILEDTGYTKGSQAAAFRVLRIFKALRAARVLRAHRIIRYLKSYQVILSTCHQSLRSMGSIIILMFLVQFMFCVIFRETFSETDPERFGSIFSTILTLFQLLTLDDWFLIYTTSRDQGAAGIIIYLIPYIVLMNFILLNLVISVLVDNFQIAIKKRTAEKQRMDKIEEFPGVDEDEVQSQTNISTCARDYALDMSVPQTNEKIHQETLRPTSLRYSKRNAELMASFLKLLTAIEQNLQTLRSGSSLLNKLFDKSFEETQTSQCYQSEDTKANLSRAEIVMTKCFQIFNLHEQLQEEHRGLPKYTTKDIADQELNSSLRGMDSHHLVVFDISAQRCSNITTEDRRLARLKTRHSKYPPLEMFAHWILESKFFSNMIVFLIFLNSIMQMIEAEIFDKIEARFQILTIVLEVLEWSILGIFLLDILLKWLDNFRQFWKNSWNIFDFCVTILSFIPEILKVIGASQMVDLGFTKHFRKFRILRCLKMVSKFRPIRIVVLALSRSFKAVAVIYLLLFVFAFIFALAGIVLFQNYNRSGTEGLVFSESFKDLSNALITLFMLFTMDHWRALVLEVRKVPELDNITCSLYIISWLFIGSFIFRNISIGIMANTFNSVRSELSKVVQQIEMQKKADHFKAEMINRRLSHPKIPGLATIAEGNEASLSSQEAPLSTSSSTHSKNDKLDWETYVEENIQAMWLQKEDEKVMWPKDLLLHYFEVMKTLQDILDTRMQLQDLLDYFHRLTDTVQKDRRIPADEYLYYHGDC